MKLDKASLKHLIPIVIFFIITSVYFSPLYSGKVLVQSDNIQLDGVLREVYQYQSKGETIYWNNKEFSGVPLLKSSEYNVFGFINRAVFYGPMPKAIMMVMALFIGFYILLSVLGVSNWLSAFGGLAYAFSTFNIISIEVGHDYKVLAMAFMAPVLAGVILTYKGKLISGGVLTFLATGFQLFYGHIQITYYLLIMVLAYFGLVVYETSKQKTWDKFSKATGVLMAVTLVAIGCNFTKLASTLEYKSYSTRGGSELTEGNGERSSRDGLDKDYALNWSYGKMETFTLLFPYFHGGGSTESLSQNSKTYDVLISRGVDKRTINNVIENIPLYWGDQPFTAGTIYFGAILCFLFVLGLFILKSPLKWWGLGLFVLSCLLAMGKNLEWFTDIFFYNVPLYNKFRTVTMIFAIAQLVVPMIGIMALDQIISKPDENGNQKPLLKSAIVMLGAGMFFMVFRSAFFDFEGARDSAYGFPDWLVNAIIDDRKRLFNLDIIRSLIFIVLAGGGIWLFIKKQLKLTYLMFILGVLILVDLWGVNKRHLSSNDFERKKNITNQVFQPTPADQQILKDKSYYRVLNLTSQNPFSDGLTSYFHYSILGYSAIKMQRYQELIDRYIGNMNRSVLNMLNTKYFIVKTESGQPQVQPNPQALGNVWLVDELVEVNNADEELSKLGQVDLPDVAIYDKRYASVVGEAKSFSGDGKIELANYHPESMEYHFQSESDQFVVFSEIFYDHGWNAYIDNKYVEHARVDYVLRGLAVSSGEHKITFKYEPISVSVGRWVVLACSIVGIMLILTMMIQNIRSRKSEQIE